MTHNHNYRRSCVSFRQIKRRDVANYQAIFFRRGVNYANKKTIHQTIKRKTISCNTCRTQRANLQSSSVTSTLLYQLGSKCHFIVCCFCHFIERDDLMHESKKDTIAGKQNRVLKNNNHKESLSQ